MKFGIEKHPVHTATYWLTGIHLSGSEAYNDTSVITD